MRNYLRNKPIFHFALFEYVSHSYYTLESYKRRGYVSLLAPAGRSFPMNMLANVDLPSSAVRVFIFLRLNNQPGTVEGRCRFRPPGLSNFMSGREKKLSRRQLPNSQKQEGSAANFVFFQAVRNNRCSTEVILRQQKSETAASCCDRMNQ